MQLVAGAPLTATEQHVTGKLDATSNPYELPPAAREVKDQYFFGDALLVAPIAAGVKSRKVLLPAGNWYDFYSGKFVGANQTIEATPPLDRMPVFVRDGALIPLLAENRQWAPAAGERVALEIRHYGGASGSLSLYDDDGETFDYERGNFSWTGVSVTKDASGKFVGTITPDENGRPWSYGEVKWTFMPVE
jgi:alpha-D-xyloside xylohydrolase